MFSEAVDDIVARTSRADQLANIASYVRQTMREIQGQYLFARDLVEDTLVVDASPFVWSRPRGLRILVTAYYPGTNVWPKYQPPGRAQTDYDSYYYAASQYFAFAGVSIGSAVNVAYYQYFPVLNYYETGDRPAVYDRVADTWTYAPAYDVDDTTRETARNLVSNWLLSDWDELVKEGTVAKLYKMIAHPSAASSFALFKSMQRVLEVSESFETVGA